MSQQQESTTTIENKEATPEVSADNGNQEIIKAIQTLIRGAEMGRQFGSYNLKDANAIYLAINALSKDKDKDNTYTKSNAVDVLIQACNIAQQTKGAFTFKEAHTIYEAVEMLTKKSEEETNSQVKETKIV